MQFAPPFLVRKVFYGRKQGSNYKSEVLPNSSVKAVARWRVDDVRSLADEAKTFL